MKGRGHAGSSGSSNGIDPLDSRVADWLSDTGFKVMQEKPGGAFVRRVSPGVEGVDRTCRESPRVAAGHSTSAFPSSMSGPTVRGAVTSAADGRGITLPSFPSLVLVAEDVVNLIRGRGLGIRFR